MMKNRNIPFCLWKVAIFAFPISVGCSTPQTPVDHSGASMTCIQGIVTYANPIDSARVPYANAAITAWQPGKDRALVETKADKAGNFCIEIPSGATVWICGSGDSSVLREQTTYAKVLWPILTWDLSPGNVARATV